MANFIQQFIKSPRSIGGVAPSSNVLSKEMAGLCQQLYHPDHLVIELGPGLGNITRLLKKKLGIHTQLHLVEKNKYFSELLSKHFSQDKVYQTGFESLDLWESESEKPKLIISSLPWRSLPSDIVTKGKAVLREELVRNRRSMLIQLP